MKRGLIEGALALAVVGLFGWILLTQAQATREAATAARVAATGQTATSFGLVLLVGVLAGVLLAGGGVIAFLWLRLQREQALRLRAGQALRLRRHAQGEPEDGRWAAGPNAYWGRAEEPARPGPGATPLDALVQLEVLRMLRELRPPARAAALPLESRETEADDDDEAWRGWY